MSGAARLVLVGTPLGNREDLSPRARRTILEADLLLCEDTRSPQRLLPDQRLPERVSCFVGNEHERLSLLRDRLGRGQRVVFVSEAGLPVWSDPGRELVIAAIEAGFEVDVIPGPTAGTCALALSGFVAEGARFLGFIARSGPTRSETIEALLTETGATVFYEAGARVPGLLRDLAARMPTRGLVIVRELSKLHQEVIRGPALELASSQREALRGEVTLVLEGAQRGLSEQLDPAEASAQAMLDCLLDSSLKPRARAKRVAALTGGDARELYDRLRASGLFGRDKTTSL